MRPPRWFPLALIAAVSLAAPSTLTAAPTWLPAAGAAGASSTDLQVRYDGLGNTVAVWRKAYDGVDSVWTATKSASATTFGTAKRISVAPGSGESPSITDLTLAVDAQGGAVAAWTSRFTTGATPDVVVARRANDVWTVGQTISDGTAASSPSVAFPSVGTAYVAYRQTTQDYTQVRVSTLAVANGTITPVQSIAPTSADAAQPQLAFDAQGNGVLTWVETAVSFSPPYTGAVTLRAMTRKADVGPTFIGSQLVYTTRTTVIDDPAVALDAAGNATIVWGDRSTDTGAAKGVYASTRLLGSSGWPGAPVSTTGSEPTVAASTAGGAVVAWVEPVAGAAADTGEIMATDRPIGVTNFAPGVRISDKGEVAGAPAAAAGSGGTTVVTWARRQHGTETVRASAKAPNSSTYWPAQNLDVAGSGVGRPAVAVSGDGEAMALWQPAGTASVLQKMARLVSSSVTEAPAPEPEPTTPEPTTPTPTTPTPTPTGTTPTTGGGTTPTPAPTTGGGTTTPTTTGGGSTTTPTRSPVVSVAKDPSSTAATPTTAGAVSTDLQASIVPSLRSFKALTPKRFAPARSGDGLVRRGDGLGLAATGNVPGVLRVVVTSTPKGGKAKNLKPALSLPIETGTTKFVFSGRLAGKPLPAGLYKLKAVFVDESGQASNRRELSIAIKR